jgi:hypothetical protein
VVTASNDKTARLWDAVSVTDKDTREDILLLADLAEASCDMALETVGGGGESRIADTGTKSGHSGEDHREVCSNIFRTDSVATMDKVECLRSQKSDNFSLFTTHGFGLAGEHD